ncbi:MAG: hypothetical protein KJ623_03365 [Nanoarchaeota archaeon]|nr:hypothetical protein [Nanoarchaeota archaeon]MBU0962794.1 hypothetical protein [Nanoarchaeota archaeon]
MVLDKNEYIFKYKNKIINLKEIEEDKKIMEQLEREEYNTLKHFLANSMAKIDAEKEDEKYNIKKPLEDKLISLKLITFDRNSRDLYRNSHYLTNKGYKIFCELRDVKYSHWRAISIIAIIITGLLAFINIYLIGQSKGWW